MSLLELDGVCRTYDDGHLVRALAPTSLRIADGDNVAIMGPSGAGKSTLLNIIGLLDAPSDGSYRIRGVETVGLGAAVCGGVRGQLFGFVFQDYHLLAGRSALENVELGMLYGPYGHRERRRLAIEAIDRVGLAKRRNADPRTLSGGERQRIAIARAVAGRPSVLLCDEPTGNLDTTNSANVLKLLRELNRDGLTIVTVTHDPTVAAQGSRQVRVVDGVVSEE